MARASSCEAQSSAGTVPPGAQCVQFLRLETEPLGNPGSDRIVAVCSERPESGLDLGIIEHAGETLFIAPRPCAVFEPRVDSPRVVIGEIDDRKEARASFQEI